MSEEKFDLSQWKQQAEAEYARLGEKEEQLSKELDEVRSEKDKIAGALGLESSAAPSKRHRYRPKIKEFCEGEGSTSLTVDEALESLFDNDKSLLPGLTIALARLGKDDERYAYDSTTGVLVYTENN